ncbi:hypothetical protein OK074_5085 [Actinobacteria bacterium OK074]|nr:hypothetical protein OK074_5085 [Actinobacteria bacterium OK074]
MLGWLKPSSTYQERALARRAQMLIATRAPSTATRSPREDPDLLFGEAVFNSEPLHEALMELVGGLDPRHPLKETAENALAAMTALVVLRPSWIAYCNAHFGLAPEATDMRSDVCRQWVAGDVVRAWPYFAQAVSAVTSATESITELRPALTDFCGHDITALTGRAAPSGVHAQRAAEPPRCQPL